MNLCIGIVFFIITEIMLKKNNRLNILHIATNIPTSRKKSNDVIFILLNYISKFCDVELLHPNFIINFEALRKLNFKKVWNYEKHWEKNGIKVSTLPYLKMPFKIIDYSLLSLSYPLLNRNADKLNKTDIVHAHYLYPDAVIAYYLKKKYDIPYIISLRISDRIQVNKILRSMPHRQHFAKEVLKNASGLFGLNKGICDFFTEFTDRPVNVLGHGIEKEFLYTGSKVAKDKEVKILTVGSLIPLKNVDRVIRAVRSYQGDTKIKYDIVGNGTEMERLKKLADNDTRIIFHGRLDRDGVRQFMLDSDIYAMPSKPESFGRVFLEAAACKNAVLGHKGVGIDGTLVHGHSALLSSTFGEFEQQLHQCIGSLELRQRLAANAYNFTSQKTWEKVAQEHIDIYRDIISVPGSEQS